MNAHEHPTYETLLAEVKRGELNIDFAAFRMAYTRTEAYTGSNCGGPGEFLSRDGVVDIEALIVGEGNYTKAVQLAQEALTKNFADVNAHYVAAIAFNGSGNKKKASYHCTMYEKLLESIENSGNGMTKETAYVVISVEEEHALMRHQGYKVEMQGLILGEEHWYDRFSVVNLKTRKTAVLYFQCDAMFSVG